MQPNYKIQPNAHRCYKGNGKYELVLGYGWFLCSMCKDPSKSIDLVLDDETFKKLQEERLQSK